jgi:hypothetical protein
MLSTGVFEACTVLDNWWTHAQTGTRALAVKIGVEDFEANGTQELIGNIYFTDKSMGLARAQLKALGFDCEKESLATLTEKCLVGRTVTVVLEDNGKGGLKVSRFGVFGNRDAPKEDEFAMLDAALKSAKKSKPAPAASAPADDGLAPDSGEDIPF